MIVININCDIKSSRNNGFTLAELLIVVAIIAVLVAIAIPVFTTQLERSREATDAANIRAQYAEVMSDAIVLGVAVNTDGSAGKITLKQTQDGWQADAMRSGLSALGDIVGAPTKGGSAWVSYDPNSATPVTIHFDGGAAGGETPNPNPVQHNDSNTMNSEAFKSSVESFAATLARDYGVGSSVHITFKINSDGTLTRVEGTGHNTGKLDLSAIDAYAATIRIPLEEPLQSEHTVTINGNGGNHGPSLHYGQ